VPHPGTSSFLNGLACASPASCWAVGGHDNINGAVLNQALHWNARKWSLVTMPSPGGTAKDGFSELMGVACPSSVSCWAVGLYGNGTGATPNQALHWNGRKWSLVTVPSPGSTAGGDFSELIGVRCSSLANCWAVGRFTSRDGASLSQALHWNGRRWSLVATPDPGGTSPAADNVLTGVSCPSSANCWAVGSYGTFGTVSNPGTALNQALHWNGRRWSLVATPDPAGISAGADNELSGVACSSPADCWAVGHYVTSGKQGGTGFNQALHWNGRKWSLVATPQPAGSAAGAQNALSGLACSPPASCWAVGWYGPVGGATGAILNQALHWNGSKWSLVFVPEPGGTAGGDINNLSSIRCTSSARCWAVGQYRIKLGVELNQILRWNGTRWSAA